MFIKIEKFILTRFNFWNPVKRTVCSHSISLVLSAVHMFADTMYSGHQFAKRPYVLLLNLAKSRNHEIGYCDECIVVKFDRQMGSAAAEVPV